MKARLFSPRILEPAPEGAGWVPCRQPPARLQSPYPARAFMPGIMDALDVHTFPPNTTAERLPRSATLPSQGRFGGWCGRIAPPRGILSRKPPARAFHARDCPRRSHDCSPRVSLNPPLKGRAGYRAGSLPLDCNHRTQPGHLCPGSWMPSTFTPFHRTFPHAHHHRFLADDL